MGDQLGFLCKTFPTLVAGEWPLTRVRSLVPPQGRLLDETFVALGTGIRPLARVNALMNS